VVWDRLFARSPFEAIAAHAKKVHACVELLRPLSEAWLDADAERLTKLHNEVSRIENEADELKHSIRQNLPRQLFLPVPRADLLKILHEVDNIADSAEDFSVLLTLRPVALPAVLREPYERFIAHIIETSERLLQVIENLRELMAASFSGPEAEQVLTAVDEISHREWESDRMSQNLVRAILTEHAASLDPVDIILLMKILEMLDQLPDHAENCGDGLRHMILAAK